MRSFRKRQEIRDSASRVQRRPKPSDSECKPPAKKKIKKSKLLPVRSLVSPMPPIPSPFSPIEPLETTRVVRSRCTPLTADFEKGLRESERKNKQRAKKYQFRNRKCSASTTKSRAKPSNAAAANVGSVGFRNQLSPILDVEETAMTLSLTPMSPDERHAMEHSVNMDLSGISDISSIANNESVLSEAQFVLCSPDRNRAPPELPSMAPSVASTPITVCSLQSKAMRLAPPVSAPKPKAPQRTADGEEAQDGDVSNISNRFGSIDIAPTPPRGANEKENESAAGNGHRKRPRSPFGARKNAEGSMVRMEVISLSPSKSNKYGSDRVVSPVRRSQRIQQIRDEQSTSGAEPKDVGALLKDANYCFVPNPMLNTKRSSHPQ